MSFCFAVKDNTAINDSLFQGTPLCNLQPALPLSKDTTTKITSNTHPTGTKSHPSQIDHSTPLPRGSTDFKSNEPIIDLTERDSQSSTPSTKEYGELLDKGQSSASDAVIDLCVVQDSTEGESKIDFIRSTPK